MLTLRENNSSIILEDLINIPQDIEQYTAYIEDDIYKINNK